MLRDDGTGDILDQYVRFCKIADEQREKHGLTQEAIEETFRVCMEENILGRRFWRPGRRRCRRSW